MIFTSLEKFIIFSKLFYNFHEHFPYERPESKFDLAIKTFKVKPRLPFERLGQIFSELSKKFYVPERSQLAALLVT